ncbi:MAG: ComEC/Rec2 family competence protein, partial [Leptospiraceae bacterium]|nr:ComEC/Rec2 family competence protein [Leptospiraceae bacterium]
MHCSQLMRAIALAIVVITGISSGLRGAVWVLYLSLAIVISPLLVFVLRSGMDFINSGISTRVIATGQRRSCGPFLFLPILLTLILLRILPLAQRPDVPAVWEHYRMRGDQPVYDYSLLARAEVASVLKPGTYLLNVRLRQSQDRYRRRWLPPIGLPRSDRYDFSVYARVNAYDLHAGCLLDVRIYGRSAPRSVAPDSSFQLYLRSLGALDSIQLSRRYHVLEIDCPPPDYRARLIALVRERTAALNWSREKTGVLLALLLGRSGYLDRELKDRAARAGVLHLFAASGLHLGILYACFYLLLAAPLGRKHPVALLLPLCPAFGYVLFLDTPASLLRALCFTGLHAGMFLTYNRQHRLDLLLNTALVVFCIDPLRFVSVGTALSFGAVGGIFFAFPVFQQYILSVRNRVARMIAGQLSLTLAATLFTAPMCVWFFGYHTWAGQLSNLILVPLTGLLLPLLFITIFMTVCGLEWFLQEWCWWL